MLVNPIIELSRLEAAGFPKRVIFFYNSNGTVQKDWKPTGTETIFTLGKVLEPLNNFKSDIIVMNGIDYQDQPDGHGHSGTGAALTGRWCTEKHGAHTNISIDQFIGNQMPTRFKAMQVAAWDHKGPNRSVPYSLLSALGPNQPITPQGNPQAVFDKFFAGVTGAMGGSTTQSDSLTIRRRSVLDVIVREVQALQGKVSGAERAKLDAHLTSVRELEQRLQAPVVSGMCTVPGRPGTVDMLADVSLPARLKTHIDLMVAAMRCDLTRVGTITCEGGQGVAHFSWIGLNDEHHDPYSHGGGEAHAQINRWYASQFAYLMGELKKIPEGAGTMLDNTAILWLNDMADGNHNKKNVPFVIGGSCGGSFRTGRLIDCGGRNWPDVLISMMNAMGISGTKFGTASGNPITQLG